MDERSPEGCAGSGGSRAADSVAAGVRASHPASRRLAVQLVVGVVLTTAVVLGVMGGVQYYQRASDIEADANKALDAAAAILINRLVVPLQNQDVAGVEAVCRSVMGGEEMVSVAIEDAGVANMFFVRHDGNVTREDAAAEGVPGALVYRKAVLYDGHPLGNVALGINQVQMGAALRAVLADILLQMMVLEVVLTVPLILLLRYRFLRPVHALREFAERSACGELAEPPRGSLVFSSAELSELSMSVIHMRDSIRQKVEALRTEVEDHKRTGAALRDSEENLRITLNSIGDGVIATDVAGRVVRMNPVAERLTGWPSSEATGQRLPEVYRLVNVRDREPVADPIARVLAAGEEGGVSGDGYPLLIARDGREYLVADSGAPMRSAGGETLGSVLVFRDVTDESAAQEQLRQSQKLDAIGRLAGGIAHDFNNMLSGILGGAELLQASLAPDDSNCKHLAMITDTAGRAADLANKLLAFARQQEFHVVPTDIHRVIGDAVGLLESTIDKSIRIEVLLAPESCVVMGDGMQLQSIFLNLGIHAWHAMPEGGVLSISTALVDLSDSDCRGSAGELVPGRYVEVKVRDTGRGIAPANLSHIFDPFFASGADTRGTRLGLAAVYGMVRQHKGAILVRSEVGRGTYFRVLLPATREPVLPPATGAAPVQGRGRILVVDDEAIIREIAVAMLSRCGYDVLVAEDGRVALEIYRKRFAEIDLVILDMVMPAMGGRECFRELKRICPGGRILFASGVAQEEDLDDLRAQGLAGLVRKPFRGGELSRAVADALGAGSCASAEATGVASRDSGATA